MHSANSPLQEALQTIVEDGFFASGALCYRSADVSQQVLDSIRLCEEFADLAKRTEHPIFSFDKTPQGTILRKRNQRSDLFYELERSRIRISSCLQPAESLQALRSTWAAVFPWELPFTGNPQSYVCGNDVLEGELINTYASRCRDRLRSKYYRERLSTRKQTIANQILRIGRYSERVAQAYPDAQASRFDVGQRVGERGSYELNTADRLVRGFLRELGTISDSKPVLGYLFKREFLSEIGYRHHFVIFHSDPSGAVLDRAANAWKKVAGETGTFFDYARFRGSYRSWGTGLLAHYSGALLEGLRRMFQRDVYLRVTPSDKYPSFGIGQLPKLNRWTANSLTMNPTLARMSAPAIA